MKKIEAISQIQCKLPEGGKQLMGYNVEKWVNGARGRFLSKGIIINYEKVKGKKSQGSTLGGRYLIKYANGRCFWSKRNEFTVVCKS